MVSSVREKKTIQKPWTKCKMKLSSTEKHHQNIVAPKRRYWHDYCEYIGDLKQKRVPMLLSSWSFARFVCLHFWICRHITDAAIFASFQSKPITMFRFSAVCFDCRFFFFFLFGEQQVNSKNVYIFPSSSSSMLRFIGRICKWYGWSVAMTANDNAI